MGPPQVPNKPFVVLWGWLGSKEQHLNKYANMWRAMGAEPYAIRLNTWDVIPPRYERAGDGLVRQAHQMVAAYLAHSRRVSPGDERPHAPMFTHTFSNAGFLACGTLMGYASWAAGHPATHLTYPRDRFSPTQLRILRGTAMIMNNQSGFIVDSAPSQHTPDIWTRGIESALRGGMLSSLQIAAFRLLYRRSLQEHLTAGPYRDFLDEAEGAWDLMRRQPRLYLYSKADDIIPWRDVTAHAAAAVRRGTPTHLHEFEGTPHVGHYRFAPEDYSQACADFVHASLAVADKPRATGRTVKPYPGIHRPRR